MRIKLGFALFSTYSAIDMASENLYAGAFPNGPDETIPGSSHRTIISMRESEIVKKKQEDRIVNKT